MDHRVVRFRRTHAAMAPALCEADAVNAPARSSRHAGSIGQHRWHASGLNSATAAAVEPHYTCNMHYRRAQRHDDRDTAGGILVEGRVHDDPRRPSARAIAKRFVERATSVKAARRRNPEAPSRSRCSRSRSDDPWRSVLYTSTAIGVVPTGSSSTCAAALLAQPLVGGMLGEHVGGRKPFDRHESSVPSAITTQTHAGHHRAPPCRPEPRGE